VSEFNDPDLKTALRRAIPREQAPESLRRRIAALAANPAAATATTQPAMRLDADSAPATTTADQPKTLPLFRRQPFRLAVAALFAVAAVLTAVLINRRAGDDAAQQYVIPNSVYKAMVKVHEERKNATSPGDTVTTLASAAQLSKTLDRPVFAPELAKDGWIFQGGAVRNVGSFPSAQLYYTKGKSSLSVLSLPASAASKAKDGSTYDISFQGTPIAGFVKQNGLYCIVGQGDDHPLTTQEVKDLLIKHRDELVKA
jgi:hypothetical protein